MRTSLKSRVFDNESIPIAVIAASFAAIMVILVLRMFHLGFASDSNSVIPSPITGTVMTKTQTATATTTQVVQKTVEVPSPEKTREIVHNRDVNGPTVYVTRSPETRTVTSTATVTASPSAAPTAVPTASSTDAAQPTSPQASDSPSTSASASSQVAMQNDEISQ